jgi:hypothetical protein
VIRIARPAEGDAAAQQQRLGRVYLRWSWSW